MDNLNNAAAQAVLRAREARAEAALLRMRCEESREMAEKAQKRYRLAFEEFRALLPRRVVG